MPTVPHPYFYGAEMEVGWDEWWNMQEEKRRRKEDAIWTPRLNRLGLPVSTEPPPARNSFSSEDMNNSIVKRFNSTVKKVEKCISRRATQLSDDVAIQKCAFWLAWTVYNNVGCYEVLRGVLLEY